MGTISLLVREARQNGLKYLGLIFLLAIFIFVL